MFKFGEGAAASCVSFVIIAILSVIYVYFSKKGGGGINDCEENKI